MAMDDYQDYQDGPDGPDSGQFASVGPVGGSAGTGVDGGDGFFKRMVQAYALGPERMLAYQEHKKKLYQQGKIADSIVRTEPEFLKQMGMDEDSFNLLAPQEKASRVQGVIEGIGAKKAFFALKQQAQQQAARDKFQAAMQSKAADSTGAEESGDSFGGGILNPGVIGAAQRPQSRFDQLTGDEMLRLGMQSGIDMKGLNELAPVARQMRTRYEPGSVKEIPGLPDYRYVVTSPEGGGSAVPVVRSRPKPEKPKAPAGQDWIYSDDVNDFKKRLTAIDDPDTRDAVIELRRKYNLSTGKGESFMEKVFRKAMEPEQKKEETPTQPTRGPGILSRFFGGSNATKPTVPGAAHVRKWNPATKTFE